MPGFNKKQRTLRRQTGFAGAVQQGGRVLSDLYFIKELSRCHGQAQQTRWCDPQLFDQALHQVSCAGT